MNAINGIADPASRIREYSRLVAQFPRSPLAAHRLALDLWKHGQRSEACEAGRRVLALAPELIAQLPPELAAAIREDVESPDTAADRLGEVVAGFRIAHRIAEDARTLLYRVERGAERGYLRVLRREPSHSPAAAARFLERARLLQRVRHPGLAPILETGTLPDGCAYVLLQPTPGEPLSELIWRKELLVPLAPALGPVAGALAALHDQGLAYLGLEPGRLQVCTEPAPLAQLLDSQHVDGHAPRSLAIAAGPVRDHAHPVLFMAPELFDGRAEIGPAADVYAFGALAYLVLSGRPPLPAASVGEAMVAHGRYAPAPIRGVAPAVPEELASLIQAMLDKDPGWRPSMAFVAEAWSAILPAPGVH